MTRRGSRTLIQICAYLAFVTVAIGREHCDKTKCPGPLPYYKDLNCIPVYEKEGDCCATKYNCDHLKKRSHNKCYVNGKEYEIGEKLKDEDANPCDVGCICIGSTDGIASFRCAEVDCPTFEPARAGCYRKNSALSCCPGEEVCSKRSRDIPTCIVNGKKYRDGERFEVEGEPDLRCVCQSGYKGKNVEPFCAKPKHPYCSPDFRGAYEVFNNCTPVFYLAEKLSTCNIFFRCQNRLDKVLHKENLKSADKNSNDKDVCYFGNLIMRRGDELNRDTAYESACVKCTCEVPPVPTCYRLPNDKCKVINPRSFRQPIPYT
ncbi:uncharacterized protein LOC105201359 [Solenopsis invicta]|uniref:uncharacterized protein LOC105201359 n=1 Tax=Solenopsis invicta TaxID=13686 RepID=UPI000595BF7D|nr:uncharacterized protein LOC105201359 [Solenopsis invicta]